MYFPRRIGRVTSRDLSVKEQQTRCIMTFGRTTLRWGFCDIQRRQPVAPPTGLVGAGRKWNSGMATAETMACGKRTKATPTALSGACCDLDSPSPRPPRPEKPHKPITNLITCAQLYPPCQTWTQTRSSGRPCSLLLVCLVQHVPRCVAVSPAAGAA